MKNIYLQPNHFEGTSYFYDQQPEYPKDCHYVLSQCSSSNISGVHVINPIGYAYPFEVYCESENNSRGWTASPCEYISLTCE